MTRRVELKVDRRLPAPERVARSILQASHPEADPETLDRAVSVLVAMMDTHLENSEHIWQSTGATADRLNAIFREGGDPVSAVASPSIPSSST